MDPESLSLVDLFLACACSHGDAAAIAALERDVLRELPQMLSAFEPTVADEARQVLREKLLVGEAPRIARYTGAAELHAWIRVVATRTAIDILRKHGKEVATPDDALGTIADDTDDPELAYLKSTYRAELAAAFADAIGTLTSKERNLLRYQVLDRLSVDQVGALYGVHRATAARWIERARDTVIARTRKLLVSRLRVDPSDLDSILRLVQSRVDVSLSRLLQSSNAPEVARPK